MKPIEITVVQGDITESICDAIVNAANNHLWMGAGVAGAIKRRGGEAIEREAVAKGPIKSGDAVATTGGMLSAKHVIHAAGMGQDLMTSEHLIRQSTESSLRVADGLGLKSVAFPAIGTGVGGFNVAECARIMIATVREHSPVSIERVEFVLFDAKTSAAFETVLADAS
ncbi:MAG: macro domain-containing protein [candidate division Zixibacteria bacterium]|nr:macro domain-containing protein [candidate division Zixibacteria bacterium]MBU1469982.1 macro domain-containing protein [candidate division Zixibacteria bacterium]MBU2626162.1 macro domain-containing protein [candidate division Zixibacteria bacterium]